METKALAGRHAADLVESNWDIGLGTGTTVAFCLLRLAERIRDEGLEIRCVATSKATAAKAKELGIPLVELAEVQSLKLTIDGADEVDPQKRLIKGGGGALVREKVVAAASEEFVVVVSENKLVHQLGRDFLLPVEVLPFACTMLMRSIKSLGCQPFIRADATGRPFISDNGNRIIDCRFEGIEDPDSLERELNMLPGVVDNGLFIGMAGRVVVGKDDGDVQVL